MKVFAWVQRLTEQRRKSRCAKGKHLWGPWSRTKPVRGGCLYWSVFRLVCTECGYAHKEVRTAFMPQAGALTCMGNNDIELIHEWDRADLEKVLANNRTYP